MNSEDYLKYYMPQSEDEALKLIHLLRERIKILEETIEHHRKARGI